MTNDELNAMNAKTLLDSMTEKPRGSETRTSFREWLHKQNPPAQQPWSCPRCSRIYGPSVQICVVCNTKVAASEVK